MDLSSLDDLMRDFSDISPKLNRPVLFLDEATFLQLGRELKKITSYTGSSNNEVSYARITYHSQYATMLIYNKNEFYRAMHIVNEIVEED